MGGFAGYVLLRATTQIKILFDPEKDRDYNLKANRHSFRLRFADGADTALPLAANHEDPLGRERPTRRSAGGALSELAC
jgi:hypothetical protein